MNTELEYVIDHSAHLLTGSIGFPRTKEPCSTDITEFSRLIQTNDTQQFDIVGEMKFSYKLANRNDQVTPIETDLMNKIRFLSLQNVFHEKSSHHNFK